MTVNRKWELREVPLTSGYVTGKFVNSAKILGSEVGIKTHINLFTLPVSRSPLFTLNTVLPNTMTIVEHCLHPYDYLLSHCITWLRYFLNLHMSNCNQTV